MIPIFVVLYKNPEIEAKCLETVERLTHPQEYPPQVVDNGIQDESLAVVWNRMVSEFDFGDDPDPAFLLLNTDCFLQDARTIPQMERALRTSERVGFVGPMTDNWGSGQSVQHPMGQKPDREGRGTETYRDLVFMDQYVSGFCLMVRKAAWADAGGFPVDAPFYGQESALIWKALQRGWRTAICLDCFVEHLGGATCRQFKDQDEERHKGGEWFADFRRLEYEAAGHRDERHA